MEKEKLKGAEVASDMARIMIAELAIRWGCQSIQSKSDIEKFVYPKTNKQELHEKNN